MTTRTLLSPIHSPVRYTDTSERPDSKQEPGLEAKKGVLFPFHLSMCVSNLEDTRYFYSEVLGVEERRASETSVHFDFFGSQLTCHVVPDFHAYTLRREVDAEDVPVPHFGAALSYEDFERVVERLMAHNIACVLPSHVRFIGKGHEQHVVFIEDPSGHGIEIKSFTRIPSGQWT